MDKAFKKLTKSEYGVLRDGQTEPPFSGELLYNKKKGEYLCRACGNKLFDSDKKYDSRSGWPSFWDAIKGSVIYQEDLSNGTKRTEVICFVCQSHLGHLFSDGPKPTGARYCINSLALQFKSHEN